MGFSLSPKSLRFAQALRSRSFSWFWLGQTISAFGDGAFTTALAVTVYALTGSSLTMGLFLAAQIIPELLFTLLGGVAADRLPRRQVLMWADSCRALAVALIAVLAWLNLLQLWHLFVLAILFGLARSFFHPAYRAITPELVEADHLASANTLTSLSIQFGRLLGPPLGALFIAVGRGAGGTTFAFDSVTFLLSACSLLAIRGVRKVIDIRQEESPTGVQGVLGDILEGFQTIRRSTWLSWSLISATFGLVAYTGAISVALPKMVFAVYQSDSWLLATISTTIGIGSIAGAIFVGQLQLRKRGMIAFSGYIICGLALILFSIPLSSNVLPFAVLLAAFLVGFGMDVMGTIWSTLLYELVPGDKLGRVASVDLLGSLGLLPLGYVGAGLISDNFGPTMVFLLGGLSMVLLNCLPLFWRDIRALQ
jgi:MFS family permease